VSGDKAWWDEVELAEGTAELRVRAVPAGVRLVVDGPAGAVDVVLPAGVAARLGEALLDASGATTTPPASAPPVEARPFDAPTLDAPLVGGPAPRPEPSAAAPGPVEVVAWADPAPPPEVAAAVVERSLAHLRRLCEVLPDTAEIDGLGLPTFRAATRIFAVVEVIDDVPVVRFKATLDEQRTLYADARFRPDPDTGHHGWTAVRLDQLRAAEEAEPWLLGSFRLVAPADTVARLDAILLAAPPDLEPQDLTPPDLTPPDLTPSG